MRLFSTEDVEKPLDLFHLRFFSYPAAFYFYEAL